MRFEFHVSRAARERYDFDQSLYQTDGNVVFADFLAARRFAQKINAQRDLINSPESAARPAQLNAMGLIDEALHMVSEQYRRRINPAVLRDALAYLNGRLDEDDVQDAIETFCEQFPPAPVYRGEITLGEYLVGESDGVSHREMALEEMLMLHLANDNPGFAPFRQELFNDDALREDTLYLDMMAGLRDFFDTQPRFGPDDQNLFDMLATPSRMAPLSLSEQLRFIADAWGGLVGGLRFRALSSLDFITEEDKALWIAANPAPPGAGPGARVMAPVFTAEALAAQEREMGFDTGAAGGASAAMFAEAEAFTQDKDWMPDAVMIAKSTYVWLDQLSKKYGREIRTLDQIPDAELDQLAIWNINALWLIGVWERSRASERIKKMMGNPEAAASAYSLMDYRVAADLGGDAALDDLKTRAWQRGIRLASDMVPNHMGIDSDWAAEHPEWFLSLDEAPYPNYAFTGENLSDDPRAAVRLEDGYWSRKDAAVVFQHTDTRDGRTRYIYHGNDGTGLPWNDTAQLNYLDPAVREQVIRTIINVARQFPIIRFDAAMTLAKRHIQRLWFPEPGAGGAIPSRAGRGLTREAFNAAMPAEFWREVVDRCAAEAPDTLLLAEAFWLMEGYFVRTLGMHRVYNSAFMVMLRDEENAGYRSVIKNTIEFDTGIVNRYVNFLNNPDEKTAVEQFGKGDKYFGVCTLMATLPGLPMFGHGQIEGFTEKYGMEYRRAYYDETPDEYLVKRHEREIFPLLKKRYVFADSKNFLLYDFYRPDGGVDENVFAYSNAYRSERGLMLYNNSFSETRGSIRVSAAYSMKAPELAEGMSEEEQARAKGKQLAQRTLGDGLGLHDQDGHYVIFRDLVRDLEYIRPSSDLCRQGMALTLHAYERFVFVDFREVISTPAADYARLAAELGGQGVPSVDEALADLNNQAVLAPYRALVNAEMLHRLTSARVTVPSAALNGAGTEDELLDEIEQKSRALFAAAAEMAGAPIDDETLARESLDVRLKTMAGLHLGLSRILADDEQFRDHDWAAIHAWTFTHGLGKVSSAGKDDPAAAARSRIDDWRLGNAMKQAFRGLYMDEYWADQNTALAKILTAHQEWWKAAIDTDAAAGASAAGASAILDALLADDDVRAYIKVNRFEGATYFNQESFENLLTRLFLIATQQAGANIDIDAAEVVRRVNACEAAVNALRRAARTSAFKLDKLIEAVGSRSA